MFDFLVYLVQSSLCLAALYLIYKVAMSHETLHATNRALLLGSILLSALLPLCHVKVVKEYDPAPTLSAIEIDDMVVAEVAELGVDYVALMKDVAVMIFWVGVAFMLVRLAVGIYSVWRLIHSGRLSVIEEDVTLTVVDSLSSPFSWFGHIVASEEDVRQYRDMILSHELAHIRLRHSWDVMAVDVAMCLWWFNPAMWLVRRELQSLHEYQADEAVLRAGADAKNYQMLLIKRAVGSRLHSVDNCLNHSNLKNRITMMCKNQSSRWAATKALLVVPMVAVALSAFATTEYVPRDVQDKVTENSVNMQDEEKPNPIVVVNGEKISYDEMSKIDPNTIHSMNVYKDYSKLPKELKISEDEAKNGVIVITLKKDGEGDANVAASEKMIVIADKRESGPQTQTQSSTVSILGNTDATEKTTVKVSTKDGEKPTIIINGEEVPYASLSDIQSDTVESMDVYKLEDGTRVVYIALESNTTIDGFETKKQEFEQKKQEFEQKKQEFEQKKQEFEQKSQQQDMPYIKVEKMPTFRGSNLTLFQTWMQSNVKYPAEAIEKGISGRVIFSFVVEKDGSMSDFTVLASPDKILADAVEQTFKSAPQEWAAGEQNGEKVRVKFTVPIVFAPVSK
ncbi:MAG: TonB family protein [Alistipes sp.]|nr:TonB family protein [Alistipes sp.]